MSRDSWLTCGMNAAHNFARRSPDEQTQVGCYLSTVDNRPLSEGYNGFSKDMDYSGLPTTRPEKYDWFLHAEENALANLTTIPRLLGGGIAYLTHMPCKKCIKLLWQFDIKKAYYSHMPVMANNNEHYPIPFFEKWIYRTGFQLTHVSRTEEGVWVPTWHIVDVMPRNILVRNYEGETKIISRLDSLDYLTCDMNTYSTVG